MASGLVDLIGFAAALATLAAFSCRAMVPLRVAAVIANILFISYGALAWLPPVLLLHIALFPLNVMRLIQVLAQRKSQSASVFQEVRLK